ncbi:CK1/CK1/CK1-G protein kinase Cki1 [Schizosaccharomyces cryophilus OY26]|uniref:non-specific serine/threonine protein kinase n=1 Tax=Schizosaccharomyces cryophilus (strain OY26 / ATCC MYA-4695 / CBS 11777 / NBRC 106824 / NRRL Y48691) TaxID=653667 RepID=S9W4S7_SCHCR|nr:CK1/CK1/CK1-G protein kinase Cki1 [Schizosaccharomyces cryophilus OY26]EPY53529.1 CK1/CK1/CK1-G protein kinase Cki1 [Schizosaccharomyces cryophilus OY26]
MTGQANVVGIHYKVGRKIGEGSFGVIFEGTNLLNNQQVAIKFEPRRSDAPQLRDEYRTYKLLAGSLGIPNVYYFGQEGLHNILVIDLLGPSLEDLLDLCGRRYSVKTVAMVAKQMIGRVQAIHERSLVYRDIKPDNFLIGRPNTKHANMIHIVDFGMVKFYRDPVSKQHIPYREKKNLSGTARYMSINTHLGREQSRRDDLEALGHVFMYFLRGSLPWQGLKAATNKQKYERIGERKQNTPLRELCAGFPEEFYQYMHYVRNLPFEATPDYEFLQSLFQKVLLKMGTNDDGGFDWNLLNNGKGWQSLRSGRSHEANTHRPSKAPAPKQDPKALGPQNRLSTRKLVSNSSAMEHGNSQTQPNSSNAQDSPEINVLGSEKNRIDKPPLSRDQAGVRPSQGVPQEQQVPRGEVPAVNGEQTRRPDKYVSKETSGNKKRSFWKSLLSCCAAPAEDA